jgi:hypothetical protein
VLGIAYGLPGLLLAIALALALALVLAWRTWDGLHRAQRPSKFGRPSQPISSAVTPGR